MRLDRPAYRRDRFRIELCEALPPTGVAQRPAEFALGLGVRGTARLGSHRHEGVAGEQPREPARKVAGWLGSDDLRDLREPLSDGCGFVVDDVVDSGAILFERKHGSRRGVVEVNERGDAATVANDREHPFAYGLDHLV